MKIIIAFLKLIRWPNLVFILLTQVLFEYCIYYRVFSPLNRYPNEQSQFWLIVAASILIAAAGYIINDYFDLNIDQINKPRKVVVNTIIGRRWVIFWHLLLSLSGLIITIIALPIHTYFHLVIANFVSIVLLIFYSTTLKKKLLIGNIIISILTAWVIGIVFLSKINFTIAPSNNMQLLYARFFKLTIIYAGFAFIISLIREVIKDMEDIDGDRKYGCKTMPIVWGINVSKVFIAVWLIVLIACIAILQFYVLQFGWWISAIYSMLLIVLPLIILFKKLFTTQTQQSFHQLSNWIKWVMLAGIISMLFLKIYS